MTGHWYTWMQGEACSMLRCGGTETPEFPNTKPTWRAAGMQRNCPDRLM